MRPTSHPHASSSQKFSTDLATCKLQVKTCKKTYYKCHKTCNNSTRLVQVWLSCCRLVAGSFEFCVHAQKYSNKPFVAAIHRCVFRLCILMRTRDFCYHLNIIYSMLALRLCAIYKHALFVAACKLLVAAVLSFNLQLACCIFCCSSIVVVIALTFRVYYANCFIRVFCSRVQTN